ncbi:MAG: ChrR family anti-sigma-E factor, partial [Rhodospirillales bacterium]
LGIATHLALCPTCRRTADVLVSIAGDLLANISPAEMSGDAAARMMARIDVSDDAENETDLSTPLISKSRMLPQPLLRYLGKDLADLKWQRLGMGAFQSLIPTQEKNVTARLLRIPAGRPVPEHTHRGLELTLILSGEFSDATGTYKRGDLQEADKTLEHQPCAGKDEDCICLAITDAPLRFRSLAARIVQPMLGI